MKVLLVVLLITAYEANASPGGAPNSACESLTPQHGADAQTIPLPYRLTLSSYKIEKGGSIRITLDSVDSTIFRGLVFQARLDPDDTRMYGTFSLTEPEGLVKLSNCTNEANTITHNSRDDKTAVSFIWTAPADFEGTLLITGTIVQTREVYWTQVTSNPIEIGDPSLSTEDPGLTSTTQSSSTITTTDAPVDNSFYTECGKTKSCLGYPSKCIGKTSCDFTMSVMKKTDHYLFEFVSYQADAMYVALALAGQPRMSEAVVMECVKENTEAKAYTSWMSGRTVSRENILQSTIKQTDQAVSGSHFSCTVERPVETIVNGQKIDLDNSMFNLLLASGTEASASGIDYHDKGKIATPKESLSEVKVYGETSRIQYKLHGIFMLLAWIGTTSIGIVCARYFKDAFSGKQAFGKDLWFIIHLSCMTLTWTLTILAFILIFVTIRGWSDVTNPHPILGTITTILCFFQPIGAYFRPHPKDPNRKIFNWAHFSAGNLAHLFAILTIFYSVSLAKTQLPSTTYYVFGGYVIYYVLIHCFLSFLQIRDYSNSAMIRQIMLIVHVIAILTFTITGIVFVSVAPF